MMTEADRILIERYLMEEVTDAEQDAIVSRMAADPVFRAEVEGMRQAIEAVRDQHRAALYEKFKAWDSELDETAGPGWRWAWWLVLPFLLAALTWLVMREPGAKQAGEETPSPTLPLSRPDSTGEQHDKTLSPPMAREEEPKDAPKPADREGKRIQDHGTLFAEYYRPYKDQLLNPEMRGSGDLMLAIDSFRLSYWEGSYPDAVIRFSRLPNESRQAENDLFCYAGALLATGRTQEAENVFEGIVRRGKSMYVAEARFALAMARLRQGDLPAARLLMQQYLDDSRAKQRPDAEKVMRAISD